MFGDIVLSQAGKVLSQLFRSSDIVGRLGGDEFLVFMRNVPSQELVLRKAKEMCNAVSKLFEQDKGVFCSVGVSCCPEDGRSYEELYRRADKALYAAKNNGRNQFVLYREVEHGSQEGSFQLTNIDQEEPGNASGLSAVLERRYLSEQLLDQLDAIVYVSDPETYELYYVNRAMYSSSGYAEASAMRPLWAVRSPAPSAPTTGWDLTNSTFGGITMKSSAGSISSRTNSSSGMAKRPGWRSP